MSKKVGRSRKTGRFSMEEFEKAIRIVENRRRLPFYQHVIEQAYKDNKVLCAVLNKLLPNKVEQTNIPDLEYFNEQIELLTPQEEKSIQPDLKRFVN